MHTPLTERKAHVELWRGSGLSKAAYCREAGIPYHRLVSWCRSFDESYDEAVEGFDVIDVTHASEAAEQGHLSVRIGAATLLFFAGSDPRWVAGVVRAVVVC